MGSTVTITGTVNADGTTGTASSITVHGGVRENIVPDEVTLTGTFRTFDEGQREFIRERLAAFQGQPTSA